MSDTYVMKVCGTCKHLTLIEPNDAFGGAGNCTNPNMPFAIWVLAPSEAAHWGCILHDSRLPAVEIPPID
jgi:hypothetical protein